MNSSPKTKRVNSDLLDKTIHSLLVVASVRERDRLCTKSGLFRVDACDSHLQPFTRWFSNETRSGNLDFLVRLFNQAHGICQELVQVRGQHENGSLVYMSHSQRLDNVMAAVTEARRGVQNLQTTYASDAHTVARLQMLHTSSANNLDLTRHLASRERGCSTVAMEIDQAPVSAASPGSRTSTSRSRSHSGSPRHLSISSAPT